MRRSTGYAALLIGVAVVLSGCGGHFYRATVQGFVVDDDGGQGLNGATVRIFTKEPGSAQDESYVVQTSTFTQGGNAGYYSTAVVWNNWFGSFGREGDTTTIWIGVEHPDYGSTVVEASGILSNESNIVAAVRLDRATFSLAALQGRVVDGNGSGVNGVRVVLDLPVVSGADQAVDRVTQTATIDATPGTFRFTDVRWSGANTTSPSGELAILVRVDDPEWGASEAPFAIERSIAVVPSPQTRIVPEPFTVARRPRTEFSTVVTGRTLVRTPEGNLIGVQGVRVQLSFDVLIDVGGPREETFVDFTDPNGNWVIALSWTDRAPGDYGDADERADAVPQGAGPGIAPGEDGLSVAVSFGSAGGVDFAAGGGSWDIVSNPRGGANRLPDNVRPSP